MLKQACKTLGGTYLSLIKDSGKSVIQQHFKQQSSPIQKFHFVEIQVYIEQLIQRCDSVSGTLDTAS